MKRNNYFISFLSLTILCLLLAGNFSFVFNLPQAMAASEKPLVVQPDKIEIYGQPGNKIKKQFTVINRGDLAVRMKVVAKDFRIIDENNRLEFFIKDKESMSQWLIPEFLEVSLKPLQSKEIDFIVAIPNEATSGGHYGAILFEPASEKTAGPKSSFGVLVLLTVVGGEGQASVGGKILSFTAPKLQNAFPAKFNLKLKNSGNTHLKAQGTMTIKNWRSRQAAQFKTEQLLVYPGTTKSFQWKWNKNSVMGFYRAEMSLVTAGKNPQKLNSQTWFIIFPWQSALYGLLVLGLLIIILLKYKEKIAWQQRWRWLRHKVSLLVGSIKFLIRHKNQRRSKTELNHWRLSVKKIGRIIPAILSKEEKRLD